MKESLIQELGIRYVLSDGAMGTELLKLGLAIGAPAELWNVEQPDKVEAVHQGYLAAGAQCLTTNTFGANRLRLQERGVNGNRAAELARAGVEIARMAARDNTWVLGSIGPCTPKGGLDERDDQQVYDAYREQAEAIAAGGVDAVLLETQTDLAEAEIAAKAIRSIVDNVPLIVTLSFARTAGNYHMVRSGEHLDAAIDRIVALAPDALGANCGIDLDISDFATIIASMRAKTSLPVVAQPNAGPTAACGAGFECRLDPETMADGVWGLVRAGANLIGGCCGTSPAHLELFRRELDQL